MNAAVTIDAIVTLLGLAMLILSAHYLSQIRDLARETRDLQRKLAERLGAVSPHR